MNATNVLVYILIGVIISLCIAAWDNGVRWTTGKYLFLGFTWIISLPVMIILYIIGYVEQKIRK
jgi:hypothetical protein